jgi:anti-anti-sigma factor
MAEFMTGTASDERQSLVVSGEVDIATVEPFLKEALACLDQAVDICEIDLGGVTFIDSSGLGALVRIRNAAHERGKRLVLTNVPPAVHRLFEVTGLAEAFDARSDE